MITGLRPKIIRVAIVHYVRAVRRSGIYLEAVRRNGGSCCHNGGALCICQVQTLAYQIAISTRCVSQDRSKCTKARFRTGRTQLRELTMLPCTTVGWGGDTLSSSHLPRSRCLRRLRMTVGLPSLLFLQIKHG